MPKSTLLIADDTLTNIELVAGLLQDVGEILFATNGEEALRITAAEHPDLVLMDVMMPVMDGFTACRAMKAQPELAEIPVIFLTGRTEKDDLVQGFEAGGVDYVAKPFHPEELRARVLTHLALKQARDQEHALRVQLEEALGQVKQLSGLLPICAQCKKIRDDSGGWNHLETYISAHSEADFTHGLCPDCSRDFIRS